MGLCLGIAIVTKSMISLASQAFVDEVGGVYTPAIGQLTLPYLGLSLEDSVPNIATALALIRPAAKHALPRYDTNGEVVCRDSVIVLAHDLRRHITRCPTGLVRVVDIGYVLARDTKVR